ncbi:MAG: hypothetical protein JWQ03_586 [Variovorax sp.]|nr:hypothetical protein [Variovorax sp.]
MARTVAQVLVSARATLNDVAGARHGTTELEGFVLDAVNSIRNTRPDLFIGKWGEIAPLTGSAALPLDAQFFRPVVDYVIARAESKDAAHVESARVELMAKLSGGFLR